MCLALVMGVEGLLRIPAVVDRLPPYEPTLWHMPIIQAKIDYLKTYQARRGVDVLFIGNSTVQAGISPTLFDQIRGQEGSFNAAIEGLPPTGMVVFVRIFARYSAPQVAIYGLTPQDLNSNSPWAQDVTERVKRSPLALAQARYGWRGVLYAFLLKHSAFFRYRWVLHQLLLRGGASIPVPEPYFDERGYDALTQRLSDVPPTQRGRFVNRAGVLNYDPHGEQLESLKAIIKYYRAQDIQLILVNMPLADDYMQNFDSPEDYEQYMAVLQQVAQEQDVPLWDLADPSAGFTFGDDLFADFNHLNEDGAALLTQMLARRYQAWLDTQLAQDLPSP